MPSKLSPVFTIRWETGLIIYQTKTKRKTVFIDKAIRTTGFILQFYNSVRHQRLTQERPKFALHHGKMSTNKCREIRNYTRACFEWPKKCVKNDFTQIHNKITIYIHMRSVYSEIITYIILGLVISNVFECKTNSVFDFVHSCVTGMRNRTGRAFCKTGELYEIPVITKFQTQTQQNTFGNCFDFHCLTNFCEKYRFVVDSLSLV